MLGKGLEVLHVFFFLDQHKGDDECVKDFSSGCCASSLFDGLGILNWVCIVFILKKEYFLNSGSFGDFGNKGILESVIDYTHRFCPKFLFSLWEESCNVVKLGFVGFLLLGYELPFPLSNHLIPQEKIKREIDPLWSIKTRQ
jgi:hypothetical protein